MKRAALYVRVSTDDQAEQGTSLESQLEACRKYAQANGYMIVAELREEGASGATLARPQLDKLRDMVDDALLDVVVIYKLDRLSRDTGQMLALLKEFKRRGVSLRSATVQLEDTPEGTMMLTMLAAIGAYERSQFMERSRRGKETRVRQGKVVGTTMPPYAFRYVVGEGRFELQEEEGEVVKEIFDGVVNKGLSLYEVARRLNERHVPTPRGGDLWRKSTIKSILTNPIYTGKYAWGRTKSVAPKNPRKLNHNGEEKSTNQPRPQSDWLVVDGVVPRLVSDDMFEAVGAQLERNKVLSVRACQRDYLLRGYVKCGYCGGTLRGHANNGVIKYECYHRDRRTRADFKDLCISKSYHADRLEAAVWGALEQLITTPELLARVAEEREPGREKVEKQEQEKVANLQKAIAKVEQQLDRLLDLYVDGTLSREKYEQKAKPLNDEKHVMEDQVAEVRVLTALRGLLVIPGVADLERFCKMMTLAVKTLSFEEKRRLMELSNIRILVTADTIHIEGAFKTELLGISLVVDLPAAQLMGRKKSAASVGKVEAAANLESTNYVGHEGDQTTPLSTQYQHPQR